MIWRIAFRTTLGLLISCVTGLAYADDSSSDSGTVPALLRSYSQLSDFRQPELSDDDVVSLESGNPIVNVIDDAAGDGDISAMTVVGMHVLDAPRLLVWLSVLGGSGEHDSRYTRAYLSRSTDGSYVRYQHINLPWPFRDRHWVIDCEKNVPVADASDGLIWEHRWRLREDGADFLAEAGHLTGLADSRLEKSVYLPANSGAWALFDMGENRTLIVVWTDFAFGGIIPGPLARSFAKRRAKIDLALIGDRSERVAYTYNGKPVIYDGHGVPILPGQALEVAERWRTLTQLAAAESPERLRHGPGETHTARLAEEIDANP